MAFAKSDVAAECSRQGGALKFVPSGVDPVKLLWAICGNESSFGANCTPRHEPAYDLGGLYAKDHKMQRLLQEFGRAAACSYGPMQVMLVNCPDYCTPESFASLVTGISAGVFALQSLLIHFKPQTLSEIGSCYNAGHIQHPLSPGVQRYANDLITHYKTPMS